MTRLDDLDIGSKSFLDQSWRRAAMVDVPLKREVSNFDADISDLAQKHYFDSRPEAKQTHKASNRNFAESDAIALLKDLDDALAKKRDSGKNPDLHSVDNGKGKNIYLESKRESLLRQIFNSKVKKDAESQDVEKRGDSDANRLGKQHSKDGFDFGEDKQVWRMLNHNNHKTAKNIEDIGWSMSTELKGLGKENDLQETEKQAKRFYLKSRNVGKVKKAQDEKEIAKDIKYWSLDEDQAQDKNGADKKRGQELGELQFMGSWRKASRQAESVRLNSATNDEKFEKAEDEKDSTENLKSLGLDEHKVQDNTRADKRKKIAQELGVFKEQLRDGELKRGEKVEADFVANRNCFELGGGGVKDEKEVYETSETSEKNEDSEVQGQKLTLVTEKIDKKWKDLQIETKEKKEAKVEGPALSSASLWYGKKVHAKSHERLLKLMVRNNTCLLAYSTLWDW